MQKLHMRRVILFVLFVGVMFLSLGACTAAPQATADSSPASMTSERINVRIAALKGPTGTVSYTHLTLPTIYSV